ncbi:hypothetical protein QAD02_000828, partial [Eretmocerus hayati]
MPAVEVVTFFPLPVLKAISPIGGLGYEGEPYYERIYPKMSQAIVLTMLAAQDFMDRRRCSFELYGADFMVMEDLSVWLIEINTNPRMHPPSSRITQRLYGSVLDSLIKVVMDLPLNPNADTGGFELVYRQSVPETQPYLGPCLFALGKSMCLHESPPRIRRSTQQQQQQQQQQQASCCNTNINMSTCGNINSNNGQGCIAGNNQNTPGPWAKQFRAWTAPPMVERLREPKVVDFIACLNNAAAASSTVCGSTVKFFDEDDHEIILTCHRNCSYLSPGQTLQQSSAFIWNLSLASRQK